MHNDSSSIPSDSNGCDRQVLCGNEFDDADSGLQRIRALFLDNLGPNALALVTGGAGCRRSV